MYICDVLQHPYFISPRATTTSYGNFPLKKYWIKSRKSSIIYIFSVILKKIYFPNTWHCSSLQAFVSQQHFFVLHLYLIPNSLFDLCILPQSLFLSNPKYENSPSLAKINKIYKFFWYRFVQHGIDSFKFNIFIVFFKKNYDILLMFLF